MKKLLFIMIGLLLVSGCGVVESETSSSRSAIISEETSIDRGYTVYEEERRIAFMTNEVLEISQIRHNPSTLPDHIIIYTPMGTPSTNITLKVRGAEVTAEVAGNINNCTNIVIGPNGDDLNGINTITMNITEDVLVHSNPEDFIALYVSGEKICYWYLNKFEGV